MIGAIIIIEGVRGSCVFVKEKVLGRVVLGVLGMFFF